MPDAQRELTERELLKLVRKQGCHLSSEQLRRWRQADLIPRPRQRGLGRKAGTVSLYPADAAPRLIALNSLLKQDRSLNRAAWRLWWSQSGFPTKRIRKLLERQLLWIRSQRAALEKLDEMDSEQSWETFDRIEKHFKRKRIDPLIRPIRRKVRADGLMVVVLRCMAIGTGFFDRWEASDDALIFSRALGFDKSLDDRPDADNPKASLALEEIVRAVAMLLDPKRLGHALQSARDIDLESARNELRHSFRLFRAVRMGMVLSKLLRPGNLLDAMLSGPVRLSLKDELHLFLLWLSVRSSKKSRKEWQTALVKAVSGIPRADN